jgi:lipoprotein NlpI
MRLGRRADATSILEQIGAAAPLGSWQDLLARFLLEQLPADKLLAKAKTDGERTEAHAYVGAMDAIAGRRDEARMHLRWVIERGLRNYVEYRMAIADLARLEGSAKQPD